MEKSNLALLGSQTAKAGFKNENDIADKFNNWKNDFDAQLWLKIMGYDVEKIEQVVAIILPNKYKADIQVQITIFFKEAIAAENVSIKLVRNPNGFNQIDKRWVDKYSEMWNFAENIKSILKLFTGELPPNILETKYKKRMLLTEIPEADQKLIVEFFEDNRLMIVSDILKGRELFSANWMLVALNINGTTKWILKHINEVLNIFGNGTIRITERGSLRIGEITMQRKGGDNGRITANMLQFKINPVLLFRQE